jgi:carbonic anhydrase
MGPFPFPPGAVYDLECFGAHKRPLNEELFMRLPALAALFFAMATLAAAQTTAPWTYEGRTGPMVWGNLDPSYKACSKGRVQSPIDIRHAHLDKALQPIEFHYIAGPVTLENNGHTIEAHVDPGSYIVSGGTRYELIQFHFHHPSENAIRGKLTDLEVHLVHRSADGKLAVVAVLMTEDVAKPNAVLAMLWLHMPAKPHTSEKVTDMVNPGGFLPADRGYWTFQGSLTTPPCTEGVSWFVFEEQMPLSREQLRTFSTVYTRNTRPIQEMNHRQIEADE